MNKNVFQILLDAEDDPRQLRDKKGNVLATNAAGKKFFGVDKFPFSFFETPDNVPALQDLTDALCLGLSVSRSVRVGENIFQIFIKKTDDFFLLGLRDISFIQEAVSFLQHRLNVFEQMTDKLPVPFLLINQEGHILLANTCFCTALNHSKEDIIGTPDTLYLKPYNDGACFFNQKLYEKKEFHFNTATDSFCGIFLF